MPKLSVALSNSTPITEASGPSATLGARPTLASRRSFCYVVKFDYSLLLYFKRGLRELFPDLKKLQNAASSSIFNLKKTLLDYSFNYNSLSITTTPFSTVLLSLHVFPLNNSGSVSTSFCLVLPPPCLREHACSC